MTKTERIRLLEQEVAALKARLYTLEIQSAQGIPMPYPVFPIPWQPWTVIYPNTNGCQPFASHYKTISV